MKHGLRVLSFFMAVCPLWASAAVLEDERRGSNFAIAVHAGANFANVNTPADISVASRTGYVAGLELELPLSTNISLQPEASFSQRNAQLSRAGGPGVDARWNSLEVPLFLKLSLGSTVRPFLLAGPQATWNLSSNVAGTGAGQPGSISLNPNTLEWAAVVGAGIDLSSFFLTGRYHLGITDVDTTSVNWQSRGFQLLAGIRFL